MKMFSKKSLIISLGLSFIITGCNSPKMLQLTQENSFINTQSALQIRDIQVRTFNNTTKENLSNAIIGEISKTENSIKNIPMSNKYAKIILIILMICLFIIWYNYLNKGIL